MSLRTLLFVVALAVIFVGIYLLVKGRRSKTTITIANIGTFSSTSLGLGTLAVGAVLAYFCVLGEKRSEAAQSSQAQERQAGSNTVSPAPQMSVIQSSTGDGSPNMVNGGSVTLQVEKSRNNR